MNCAELREGGNVRITLLLAYIGKASIGTRGITLACPYTIIVCTDGLWGVSQNKCTMTKIFILSLPGLLHTVWMRTILVTLSLGWTNDRGRDVVM